MADKSFWDTMKSGFNVLVDDPGRMKRSASGQLDVAGNAIGEALVPDEGVAARNLASVLGQAWDELSDMDKQRLIAAELRNKETVPLD